MNLQEDIQRIKEVMNINESLNKNLMKLIDEKGVMYTAKFTGGYDTLVDLLGDYQIPKELLIKDIKNFIDEIYYTVFSFSEFSYETIPYKEVNDEYHEIVELGSNGVLIETLKGEYRVPYEELTYKTIVDIFEIISEQISPLLRSSL